MTKKRSPSMDALEKKESEFLELVVDNTNRLHNTDGFDGPGDWLRKVEIGSIFLVKEKNSNNFALGQFALMDKEIEMGVSFLLFFNEKNREITPVDNNRFCNRFDYVGEVGRYGNDSGATDTEEGTPELLQNPSDPKESS